MSSPSSTCPAIYLSKLQTSDFIQLFMSGLCISSCQNYLMRKRFLLNTLNLPWISINAFDQETSPAQADMDTPFSLQRKNKLLISIWWFVVSQSFLQTSLSFVLVHPPVQQGAESRLNCSVFDLKPRKRPAISSW